MSGFRFTREAFGDLFSIWTYIARHNPEAADRVEHTVLDACSFLAKGPLAGHIREDLTALPLRFWSVRRYPNYIIVYDPATTPLQIIRILHRKRDVEQLLNNP